jgi:hypothetical protein
VKVRACRVRAISAGTSFATPSASASPIAVPSGRQTELEAQRKRRWQQCQGGGKPPRRRRLAQESGYGTSDERRSLVAARSQIQLVVLRRKVKGRAHLTNNDRWFLIQM